MRFTIRWREAAINDLAAAWQEASSAKRASITAAVHHIEQELRFEPHSKGESRANDERIVFSTPVAVLFHVEDQDWSVVIEEVWLFDTH